MEDFLKMDIFFVVATVATALVGVLLIVLLAYAVRFMRTINRIGDQVEEEAEAIREDIRDARASVRGFRFSQLFSFMTKSAKRVSRKKKS